VLSPITEFADEFNLAIGAEQIPGSRQLTHTATHDNNIQQPKLVTSVARTTVPISSDSRSEPARALEQSADTMPMSLEAPVLQVDANVIHKVDTTNPANLFSMWTGEFTATRLRALRLLTTSISLCKVS
jgi:hypothetical protein